MKPWVKVLLIVIVIVAVYSVGFIAGWLGVLGMITNTVDEIKESMIESEISNSNSEGVTNGIVNVKVGDTVEFGTFKMTIVDSERMGSKYNLGREGYEIVRVGLEVKNISTKEQYFGDYFKAYCDDVRCQKYKDIDSLCEGYIIETDSTIEAGRKIKGSIYYAVPIDAAFEIEYHPSGWDDNYIIIEIQ